MPRGAKMRSLMKTSSGWPLTTSITPPEDVGGDGVVELRAGLEEQRERGPRVGDLLEVHALGRAEDEAAVAVDAVQRLA